MFDVGFWELVLVGVVALLVVGPERLPEVARTAGRWLGTARRMVSTFKADVEREIRADQLKEVLRKQAEFKGAYEVLEETRKDLQGAVDQLNTPIDDVGAAPALPSQASSAPAPAAPAAVTPAAPAPPAPAAAPAAPDGREEHKA